MGGWWKYAKAGHLRSLPTERVLASAMDLPIADATGAHARDLAQPLRMRAKLPMAQETARVFGHFIKNDIKMHETVARMKNPG